MKNSIKVAPLALFLILGACDDGGDAAESPPAAAEPAISMPMEGTSGMPGMAGMPGMGDGGMMGQMQERMDQMMADPDRMMTMMPQHRQMAANMLAQMNREMRDMNMTADESWTATVDSLREDLTRMPEMTPAEMQALMPAHHARMERLMGMHREMMSETEM